MKQRLLHAAWSLLFIALSSALFAQLAPPDGGINFQAVARDASGSLIVNGTISVRFTLVRTTPFMMQVYSENHLNVSTDAFGHFSLVMGTGTPLFGNFAAIDWGSSAYQVGVGMDPAGGTAFINMGTMPLQKVPKTYHADIADSVKFVHLAGLEDVSIDGSSLQVGDQLVWDGSNWVNSAPANSHTVFIGTMNFVLPQDGIEYTFSPSGAYIQSYTTTTPLYAPLNLPVGSEITEARVYYMDNISVDLSIEIRRVFQNATGTDLVATYTTVGAVAGFRNDPMIVLKPIIEDDHFYHIRVAPVSGAPWYPSIRIRGIEITYTLP